MQLLNRCLMNGDFGFHIAKFRIGTVSHLQGSLAHPNSLRENMLVFNKMFKVKDDAEAGNASRTETTLLPENVGY